LPITRAVPRRQRRRPACFRTDYHAKTLAAVPRGLSVEETDRLWAVMGLLVDDDRIPLLLQGYAGYPLSAIATLQGRKLGTLKSRLHQARVRFQERYAA
jgi:DNA-directed RNA polymerase specialized sigma24 family protein